MNYIIYKITNKINNKIYIGCHKCTDIDDKYMGSGTAIKNAIAFYGIENFGKEVLHVFNNPEDMFDMEAEIVNEAFVKQKDNYNIKIDAVGGFGHINNNSSAQKSRSLGGKNSQEITKKRREEDPEYDKWIRECRATSKSGWNHSEESKQKMKDVKKNHGVGKKNSQYGTRWYMPKSDTDKSNRKKFRENNQPEDWITTLEWDEIQKQKKIEKEPNNHRLRKKWYTDGVKNFLILPEDASKDMFPGQTRNHKFI